MAKSKSKNKSGSKEKMLKKIIESDDVSIDEKEHALQIYFGSNILDEDLNDYIKSLKSGEIIPEEMASDSVGAIFDNIGIKNKYPLYLKQTAITFLQSTQRPYIDNDGVTKFVPMFTQVSKMLDIPKERLWAWWQNREMIVSQSNTLMNNLDKLAELGTGALIIGILAEFQRRGLNEISNKNLVYLLNTLARWNRIFGNKSTHNVDHHHQAKVEHSFKFVPPDKPPPEDDKK